jgi:hypothetical protein
MPQVTTKTYSVDEDGNITSEDKKVTYGYNAINGDPATWRLANQQSVDATSQREYSDAIKKSNEIRIKKLQDTYEQRLADVTSQENTRNTLASQIQALTGGGRMRGQDSAQSYNQPPASLSAESNFGTSDLSTRLNFQVSDQDILSDYNNTKLGRLNKIIEDGSSQIAGINSRLQAAQSLYDQLPSGDARAVSAKVAIDQLKSDLASVQGAVTKASRQVSDFKPVTTTDEEGLKQITSFREFAKLPEQRASDQLRQIDPEAYRTAVGLGRQYRQMATQPLGATTTPQTEELRNTLEQEALNQLRLGSTIGAEERRGYEQSIRAAQTARGNIFGLGPAVQEAAQLGAAGEARKLARYGAAQSFLGSGETTGAATARDLALREGLQQNRLGAASNFIAGGPSLYNLAGQRLAQQNASFQNYINANQAMPNQFQTGPAANQFYQTTNPAIPVQLASNASNIYNTMSDYQAQTYGAQVGAQAATYTSPSKAFANIAGGLSGFMPNLNFGA